MTKKKLSLLKAFSSLAIIVTFLAFCAFFFTYGKKEIQRVNEPGAGIGAALSIIPLVCFALPGALLLLSLIGNFIKKGKTVAFTIVSLVAEILGMAALFFVTILLWDLAIRSIAVLIATILFDLLVVASFVISIIVLAKQKTAIEE